jgi:hypothetical protein
MRPGLCRRRRNGARQTVGVLRAHLIYSSCAAVCQGVVLPPVVPPPVVVPPPGTPDASGPLVASGGPLKRGDAPDPLFEPGPHAATPSVSSAVTVNSNFFKACPPNRWRRQSRIRTQRCAAGLPTPSSAITPSETPSRLLWMGWNPARLSSGSRFSVLGFSERTLLRTRAIGAVTDDEEIYRRNVRNRPARPIGDAHTPPNDHKWSPAD